MLQTIYKIRPSQLIIQLLKTICRVKPQNRTVETSSTMKHFATKLVLPLYILLVSFKIRTYLKRTGLEPIVDMCLADLQSAPLPIRGISPSHCCQNS